VRAIAFLLCFIPNTVSPALAFKPAVNCVGQECSITRADVVKLRAWVEAVFQHIEMIEERDRMQTELIGQMRSEISRIGAGCKSRGI